MSAAAISETRSHEDDVGRGTVCRRPDGAGFPGPHQRAIAGAPHNSGGSARSGVPDAGHRHGDAVRGHRGRHIPGPSGQIGIRITRPLGAKEELPAVMYFHGGGWVVGDRDTHDRLVRDLAHAAHAAIVFVDYSRAPEAQYPVAIEEAYAATAWVKAHGRSVGLDPSRLAVAGDSAGGNMAAVVTLLAKLRGGPAIDYQVLFCPAVDASGDMPSHAEFADGYILTRAGLASAWDRYAPAARSVAIQRHRRCWRRPTNWPGCLPPSWSPRNWTSCGTKARPTHAN